MHRWLRALGIAVLLSSAGSAAGAPAGAAAAVKWAPSIQAGLAEAKARGCPLLVALNMDGERANDEMMKTVYGDPAFLAAAAKCVCTIGSLGTHAEAKDPAAGRMVCSRFGSLTCGEHQAVERVIRNEWLQRKPGEDVSSPRHFLLAPDGRRLFDRTWLLEPKELAALMAKAGECCAPAVLAAWDTVDARLKRVSDPLRPVRGEAIRALAGAKDAAVDGRLAEAAKASTNEDATCDVLDAFAADTTPARRALAAAFLGAKGVETRMHAAVALEAARDADAVKDLVAALGKERDPTVRGVLFRAVSGCDPKSPAARAAVLAGFKEKGEVLANVCVAAAPWAEEAPFVAALQAVAFGNGGQAAQAAGCWALGLSKHRELAEKLRAIEDPTRRGMVKRAAEMAASFLSEGGDAADYRRRAREFVRSPVRHPGEPED